MQDNAQYTSAYPAITDVLSRPRDNIVLLYGNSNTNTYNALAFQIVRANRRVERVEDAITISADSAQAFGYFGENGFSQTTTNPGNKVFSIDSERSSTIIEYGFAIPQDGVYVGVQTGDGDTINGLTETSDRDRGFSAGDLPTRGGILSDHTRVDAPTATQTERVPTTALSETLDHGLIRIDSEQQGDNPFYFGFYNATSASVTIDVTGYGYTYDVRPITDAQTVKQMVRGDGFNRKVVNYGAFGNTNPNLPREWFDYVTQVGPGELTP